ncbi:MAG: spore cortex-lytic enzyme [Firmicutes bacterium]|nr:spore cortex-lytic enzyme [Bacillota bacterium]
MLGRSQLRIISTLVFLVFVITLLWISYPPQRASAQRPTLYWGSSGRDVRLVQWKLQQWGYYRGPIDGIYGPRTFAAVKDFQRKNGLTPDGVCGNATWAALGFSTGPVTRTAVSTRGVSYSDEVEILARAITGEARGEPYIGQVAVGAVILNRVRSGKFPNSIAGVVYQPGAFTAVADGQINLEPTPEARRAAIDALNGWDPTYGALYYYNPAKTTNQWIYGRPIITQIGKHIFAR